MRDIFASVNISPPSSSGMQQTANKVNPSLIDINKEDMRDKVQLLKQVKACRGQYDDIIDVEGDCLYNNPL